MKSIEVGMCLVELRIANSKGYQKVFEDSVRKMVSDSVSGLTAGILSFPQPLLPRDQVPTESELVERMKQALVPKEARNRLSDQISSRYAGLARRGQIEFTPNQFFSGRVKLSENLSSIRYERRVAKLHLKDGVIVAIEMVNPYS